MPETGSIAYLGVPEENWLRFENALDQGQKITADFDPMLAKMVVHGATRDEAIARSIIALDALAILGVRTNIDYLMRVLDHPAFRAGDLHTAFVNEHKDMLRPAPVEDLVLAQVVAAAALGFRDFRDLALGTPEPHAAIGGWRN